MRLRSELATGPATHLSSSSWYFLAALTNVSGISTFDSPGYGRAQPVLEYQTTWLRKFGSTASALSYLFFITSAVALSQAFCRGPYATPVLRGRSGPSSS